MEKCYTQLLMKLKEASLADIYAEVEKVAGDMIARNANWQAKSSTAIATAFYQCTTWRMGGMLNLDITYYVMIQYVREEK